MPPYGEWVAAAYPRLSWHWPHLKLIFAALQEVADGTLSRLLISMPPQHGKTESTTVRFPVYAMLRRPGVRVGLASYSQTYANRLSRKVRRAALEAGRRIGGKDAANEWELADGSSLYAVGVGGGITGRSIDLMVIDDPVKGRQEADSEAFRDRAWEWYADDITTRMQEGTAVVMIQTRWHLADLAGRVLASDEGPKWKYLRLPAIAEPDDPMGRAEGDPLCPDRFTLATLLDRRRNRPETFEALYQQNPVPRGGLFFRREWFPPAAGVPEVKGVRRVRYWDLAGCFVAGTLVQTEAGLKSIEDVRVGDRVLTRQGYKRVKKAWLTKYVDGVTSVTFSNGSTLTGTGGHRVWTDNRGWVPLDELDACDYNTSITQGGDIWLHAGARPVCRTRSTLSTTASLTPVGPVASTTRRTAGTKCRSGITPKRCTKQSGVLIGGSSPTGMTFTTSTATTTIMSSKTWGCSLAAIMPSTTTASQSSTRHRPLRFTTSESESSSGPVLPISRTLANSAAANSSRGVFCPPHTVPSGAVRSPVTTAGVPVYDLEVEDAHEFFANGILVHNSTKDTACWTAGVLLAYDGTHYYVEHVERFRLGPAERNDLIRRVAELDAGRRGFERTYFEEQPGAAGIETSQAMVRRMAGLPVRADRVTGDKRTRAEPLADAARGGLVRVVEGHWVPAYLNELTNFPRGASLDQVDSSSGAYNLLAKGTAGISIGAGR